MIIILQLFGLMWIFLNTGNDLVAGSLESYSTRHSIGFEWNIIGDDNVNATCLVEYRAIDQANYKDALPLYRVDFEEYNMLAGSIFFLEPGTTYEIKLNLVDPDGTNLILLDTVTTLNIPEEPSGGQVYHVKPGNGGGIGTESDPFLGVDAAEQIIQPGDICLLHGGNYGGTINFNSAGSSDQYIVWKKAADEIPIFNGIRIEADYLWFEGLTIVDQQYGLRTSEPGPKRIVVKHCEFYNNHYSIFLNDGGEEWYISNNIIVGDNIPNSSNFSGEGIELWHTSGHTVCYNTISRVADGISYPHKNVDMFGNDIFDTSDDGIEFDYGHANNRAWGNRITNLYNNGISFQPMNGAPFYVLYNQVSVLNDESVLKLRDRSDRALIAHNTFIANSGPVGYGAHFLVDFEIKNNLWVSISDRYIWENGESSEVNWKTDFDYNGFDWGDFQYAFKWGDRLDDINEFIDSTGQETHGIVIDHLTCFDSLGFIENNAGEVDSFFVQYFILNPNCNAVDAGIPMQNINEGFIGSAPDLGAYEVGQSLPHYGVRAHCFTSQMNKWVGPPNGNWYADESNWSQNRFPNYCDSVVIDNAAVIHLGFNKIGKAKMIELKDLAKIQIDSGGLLKVLKR